MRRGVMLDLVDSSDAHGPELTLQEARRLGVRPRPRRSSQLDAWPAEPHTPAAVEPDQFARALAALCPTDPSALAASRLSPLVLDAAGQFEVDPFLLAALIFQQSRCNPRLADRYGIGLTRINVGMWQDSIHHGALRYPRPTGPHGFELHELPVPRYAFEPSALRDPKINLYFAAALLRMNREQCPAIDRLYAGQAHRHFVSHFIWGDRVGTTLPEDEILIARRRLLQYYAPYERPAQAHVGLAKLLSPLDAWPRLVIGMMGDLRDGGRRIHLGIDLGAAAGEPVRAMADGIVTFAGADFHQRGLVALSPDEAERAPRGSLAPRGLFVRVRHVDGVETLYAHLASYRVTTNQEVTANEVLGRVGDTGSPSADPHLHLGVFVDGIAIDPWPVLRSYGVLTTRRNKCESPRRR